MMQCNIAWISFCINETNFSSINNEYILHSDITDSGMHSVMTLYFTGIARNWKGGGGVLQIFREFFFLILKT
jgi:hypothetical protein